MTDKVLSYDLGGTKLATAVVTSRGRILEKLKVASNLDHGQEGLTKQMATQGRKLLRKYPGIRRIGIASAGPLDPVRGRLWGPTNFPDREKEWSPFEIKSLLEKKLHLPVSLENDAAAAIVAEHWIGKAKRKKNAMILTLGTGLGTGVVCNGELLRSGHYFHTEAGHMIIRDNDVTALCGCGNYGCAEAYLSGNGFSARFSRQVGNKLSALEIATLARRKNKAALAAFSEYAERMGTTLYSFFRIFTPEVFILTGSFAESSDLFLKQAKREFKRRINPTVVQGIPIPSIVLSSLHNNAGLIGAAYCALKVDAHTDANQVVS